MQATWRIAVMELTGTPAFDCPPSAHSPQSRIVALAGAAPREVGDPRPEAHRVSDSGHGGIIDARRAYRGGRRRPGARCARHGTACTLIEGCSKPAAGRAARKSARCGRPCSPRSARPRAGTTSTMDRLSASRRATFATHRHIRATRPSHASDRCTCRWAAAPPCAGWWTGGRNGNLSPGADAPHGLQGTRCDPRHAAGKIVVDRQPPAHAARVPLPELSAHTSATPRARSAHA